MEIGPPAANMYRHTRGDVWVVEISLVACADPSAVAVELVTGDADALRIVSHALPVEVDMGNEEVATVLAAMVLDAVKSTGDFRWQAARHRVRVARFYRYE